MSLVFSRSMPSPLASSGFLLFSSRGDPYSKAIYSGSICVSKCGYYEAYGPYTHDF